MSRPTAPNRTRKATASDTVMTPPATARKIIDHFSPEGVCLDPCRGTGSFYSSLPTPRDWCEVEEGRDFLLWEKKVDWIITNPPYSIYDLFLEKSFSVSDNVVFFVPIAKAFKSMKVEKLVRAYGGLKELVFMGGGGKFGFGFGFPVGCLYYKRGYTGPCQITYWDGE